MYAMLLLVMQDHWIEILWKVEFTAANHQKDRDSYRGRLGAYHLSALLV
jgi:hypothetical protein